MTSPEDTETTNPSGQPSVAANTGPQQGYSGRVLVPVLAGVLVLSLICMVIGFNAVSELEAAQDELETSWQTAATDLSLRYKQAEKAIAKSADAGQIDIAFSEKFTSALERFRSTTRPFDQSAAAESIEVLLAKFDTSVVGEATPEQPWLGEDSVPQTLNSYNATLDAAMSQRESSMMQRMVCQFINFSLPSRVSAGDQ